MADKIMGDIKSGKGLPPLSNNSGSCTQPGIATEQRKKGITYETFSHQQNEKTNNSKSND